MVVRQPSLIVGKVICERAVGILVGQRRELITVKEIQIIQIGTGGETILGNDDVPLAIAGFFQERGNKSSRISAAYINHSGAKRAEHTLAVVQ